MQICTTVFHFHRFKDHRNISFGATADRGCLSVLATDGFRNKKGGPKYSSILPLSPSCAMLFSPIDLSSLAVTSSFHFFPPMVCMIRYSGGSIQILHIFTGFWKTGGLQRWRAQLTSSSLLKTRVTAGITQTAPQKSKAVPGVALLPKRQIVEMQTTNSATGLTVRGGKGTFLKVWRFGPSGIISCQTLQFVRLPKTSVSRGGQESWKSTNTGTNILRAHAHKSDAGNEKCREKGGYVSCSLYWKAVLGGACTLPSKSW